MAGLADGAPNLGGGRRAVPAPEMAGSDAARPADAAGPAGQDGTRPAPSGLGGEGSAEPTLRILHRGPRYIARFVQCDDRPWACISFEYWKPIPTLEGEFSGEGFFRHRRLNAIGIMAAENDWFQDDEILDVLAAIRAATPGFRLIGYGGSMGGFAIINFAQDLGLASLVAVIPQFSIDGARAPYEYRWREEAARIRFNHDKIDAIPPIANGWMIFDPWCVDGLHARDIARWHRLGEVAVPFGGHAQMLMLQQAEIYTDMFTDMLEERFDPAAFRRSWRVARRGSAAFWLGLAQTLLRRGAEGGALRCLAQARALPHPEPAWIDLTEADARIALGEYDAARALAGRWAGDAAFGGPAGERLAVLATVPPMAVAVPRALWQRVVGRLGRAATRVWQGK